MGAGAGGGVAAWALTRRGVRVRLLETGPRFTPSQYRTHAQDWEIEDGPLAEVERDPRRRSYESVPTPLDAKYAHLSSRSISLFSRPFAKRPGLLWSRSLGVGGSTLHYQGEAHRFPTHAFRMRSALGVAEDWPLDYAELAPFYERIETLLDVAGDPGNPFKPPRGPYPQPAHPLARASLRIGEAARSLGWSHLANPLAVLRRPRDGRAACHYCNGCSRGCDVAAKSSVDVAVIPEAERSGNLEIVTDFQVSRLEVDRGGRVTGVVGYDSAGTERAHRARAVVLAAGALETPRLLLNSSGGKHPRGVGNASDRVGRGLMEYLYVRCGIVLERELESYAGHPVDSRIWDFNGAASRTEVPEGIVLGQTAGWFEGPAAFALDAVPGFGLAHREAMTRGFGGGLELYGVAEQLPREDNRVTLSANTDRFGVPLAHVETHLETGDCEALAAIRRRLDALAEATGAREFMSQLSAYDLPIATHLAGGCSMGADSERSVVDRFGAVHGHPELVIADASVLVTQGAGDSPSLTIQALALRAAEALAERARRGEV